LRHAGRRVLARQAPLPHVEANISGAVQSYSSRRPRYPKERGMRRFFVPLGVVLAALAVAMPAALGSGAADPGITPKLLKIGGTFPLSGPASSYAPIPAGMA